MYNEKADNVVYAIPATVPINSSYPSQGQPTVTVITQQPQYRREGSNQGWTPSAPESAGPPTGSWKDGICDCCTNLYPSCFCASWFDGFWILSQMAHKTHYYRFNHLIIPFMLIWFVCFFVSFAEGLGWVYALPFIVAVIFGVMLRFHLVKYYQLTQTNCFLELLAGLFCFPCSTAQMARHVYGYRKIFDGDADPDRKDDYAV